MSSCSPCCKPSKFNVACWIIITFIGACQILAFALQVRSASAGLHDDTICIVDSLHLLTAPPATCPVPQVDALDQISQESIKKVVMALDWGDAAMMAPGAIYVGVLLLAVFFAIIALGCTGECAPTTSKLFIFLGWFAALVAFIFFAICAAVGSVSKFPEASGFWDATIVQPCDTSIVTFRSELNKANTTVQQCFRTSPDPQIDCAQASSLLGCAAAQMVQLNRFCGCATPFLVMTEPLAAPGLLGAAATLLGLISSLGLCCSLACCGSFTHAIKATKDTSEKTPLVRK